MSADQDADKHGIMEIPSITKVAQGKLGETIAADYLIKRGYRILERNFKVKGGEIDLIAWHKRTLVFIEVKLRSEGGWVHALGAVTGEKVRRLRYAIERYLFARRIDRARTNLRIDVVGITMGKDGTPREVALVENAVIAGMS